MRAQIDILPQAIKLHEAYLESKTANEKGELGNSSLQILEIL